MSLAEIFILNRLVRNASSYFETIKLCTVPSRRAYMMKRLDPFFITILMLVAGLSAIFMYTYKNLNNFENQTVLKATYERKLKLISLNTKLKEINSAQAATLNEANGSRTIASVGLSSVDIEPQLLNSEVLAQNYYKELQFSCYEVKKENKCIEQINTIVTHFPESVWAGESLVVLTDFYFRTNKINEAREVLHILKNEFSKNASIQKKIVIIERHLI